MGNAGVTLAELTIVIVVISIAALVFASFFVEAVRAYQFAAIEDDLLAEARYAQDRITREVMRLPGSDGIRESASTALSFQGEDSIATRISWSGTKGDDLVMTRAGKSVPLASSVDSLSFGFFGADGAPILPRAASRPGVVRRVAVYLRLARDGHAVATAGAAFLRATP
jgi:type II secretory pathway pseudopilin PulG